MKYFVSYLSVLIFFSYLNIQSSYAITPDQFEDSTLSKFIFSNYDKNKDNVIVYQELGIITSLNLSDESIHNLNGLSCLKYLTNLSCNGMKLDTVDLCGCKSITKIDFSHSSVDFINLQECNNLKTLNLSYTQLGNINLQDNNILMRIDCSFSTIEDIKLPNDSVIESLDTTGTNINFVDLSIVEKIQEYIGRQMFVQCNCCWDKENKEYYCSLENVVENINNVYIKDNQNYYVDYYSKRLYFKDSCCNASLYFKGSTLNDIYFNVEAITNLPDDDELPQIPDEELSESSDEQSDIQDSDCFVDNSTQEDFSSYIIINNESISSNLDNNESEDNSYVKSGADGSYYKKSNSYSNDESVISKFAADNSEIYKNNESNPASGVVTVAESNKENKWFLVTVGIAATLCLVGCVYSVINKKLPIKNR